MTLTFSLTRKDKAIQRAVGAVGYPPIEACAEQVARDYGVTLDDLKSANRKRSITWVRQWAMYCIRKEHPNASLPQIGRLFNRDHTTVIHAIEAVSKRLESI